MMKTKEVARLLAGSCVVYVLVCACAGGAGNGFGGDAGIVGLIRDAMSELDGSGTSGGSSSTSSASSTSSSGGTSGGKDASSSSSGFLPKDALAAESGSRLKARRYVANDGAKLPTSTFWDTTRNEECSFAIAADAKVRCMPAGLTANIYHADAACTQLLGGGNAGCAVPNYVSTSDSSAYCPEASTHRFARGAQFNGAQVYLKSGVNCVGIATGATQVFYYLGAEVPAGAFEQATVQNDP